MQDYATSTDCILQNLTMVIGNPCQVLRQCPMESFDLDMRSPTRIKYPTMGQPPTGSAGVT